jgi:hypothetical protein
MNSVSKNSDELYRAAAPAIEIVESAEACPGAHLSGIIFVFFFRTDCSFGRLPLRVHIVSAQKLNGMGRRHEEASALPLKFVARAARRIIDIRSRVESRTGRLSADCLGRNDTLVLNSNASPLQAMLSS